MEVQTEERLVDTEREGEGGRIKRAALKHILPYVKQTASGELQHDENSVL